ncbi:MAG TPA: IclR family transcriptional regulator [Terriglobales bacterium]
MNSDNKYPVKSLIKALGILECLGTSESGSTLTEISSKLKIGKSTVHRLLATLRDHDFVWLEPYSSRYILGARVLQLSEQLSRQSILVRHGESILSRLSRAAGETCNLGVLDGRSVLYLVIKESNNPLRMTGSVGKRLPAHTTALGKALLCGLSAEELSRLYAKTQKLEAPTEKSIATVSELMEHINKQRNAAAVFEYEETYPGVMCIGAPVRAHGGKVIAAISIAFPRNRVNSKKLQEFKTLLCNAARELSGELGYQERTSLEAALA